MKNAPFTLDSDAILPLPFDAEKNLFPTSFQEQLLNIYWIKKDLDQVLNLNAENLNDSLTDVAQLLAMVETKIIRILKNVSKSDAEFKNYWGF